MEKTPEVLDAPNLLTEHAEPVGMIPAPPPSMLLDDVLDLLDDAPDSAVVADAS